MTEVKQIHTPVDQKRLDALVAAGVPEKLSTLIKVAIAIAQNRSRTFEEKADALMTSAERISELVTPHLACSKGCNHCCYMAVSVSKFEAQMIGRYLGRNPNEAAAIPIDVYAGPNNDSDLVAVEKYTGVACTLLGPDGKCSVYPVRPVACRTHHNLGPDESNCIIVTDRSKGLPTTPSLNINGFLAAHGITFIEANQSFADIREWFPIINKE